MVITFSLKVAKEALRIEFRSGALKEYTESAIRFICESPIFSTLMDVKNDMGINHCQILNLQLLKINVLKSGITKKE